MCKYIPKVHLHTKSYQDRFRNKKVFSCVSLLLWKRAWSNGVCKMSHFEAGSRNFTARKLIFGYFVVQSILSKSYYRHFSIRPFICMRDGLKDEESVPPCCGLLYYLKNPNNEIQYSNKPTEKTKSNCQPSWNYYK